MKASLQPLDGGESIDIVKDVTVIGRQEGCDVRLQQSSISKVHLILVKTDGVLLFRDLGSTNGTRVNGQKVIRGALLPDDRLTLANCKYRVHLGPDDEQIANSETDIVSSPEPASDDRPSVRVFKAKDLAESKSLDDRSDNSKNGHRPAKSGDGARASRTNLHNEERRRIEPKLMGGAALGDVPNAQMLDTDREASDSASSRSLGSPDMTPRALDEDHDDDGPIPLVVD